ncbi:thymidylate kinase [Bacteroidia bacterium]|nr:thymidylate kinase [Bacteroidia bacterium]
MPFIVLEGLDGAGKSTQIAMLREEAQRRGHVTRYLHFPRFDTPLLGELIARFLRGDMGSVEQVDPYLVALIFACDRADAAPALRSWIEAGDTVILDRYVYSNVGYQCAKLPPAERPALKRWILELEYGRNALPRPDLNLFLDVPFEFTRRKLTENRRGDDRGYLNGSDDIHEASLELQSAVREVYLDAAQSDGTLHIVDCSDEHGRMATPEATFARILSIAGRVLDRG